MHRLLLHVVLGLGYSREKLERSEASELSKARDKSYSAFGTFRLGSLIRKPVGWSYIEGQT
jgi:hypothetical protein